MGGEEERAFAVPNSGQKPSSPSLRGPGSPPGTVRGVGSGVLTQARAPTREHACEVLGCGVENPLVLGGSAVEDASPAPRQGLWGWAPLPTPRLPSVRLGFHLSRVPARHRTLPTVTPLFLFCQVPGERGAGPGCCGIVTTSKQRLPEATGTPRVSSQLRAGGVSSGRPGSPPSFPPEEVGASGPA